MIRPMLVDAVETLGPLLCAASLPMGSRRRKASAATVASAAAVATSARRGVPAPAALELWLVCIVLLCWGKRSNVTVAFVPPVVFAASAQSRFRLTALERGVLAPIGAPMSGGDCFDAEIEAAAAWFRGRCALRRPRTR